MKKIHYFLLSLICSINLAYADTIKQKMQNVPGNDLGIGKAKPMQTLISSIESIIYTLLGVIAVGVFMFFGLKLISSRGNEEAYKKAKNGLIYAVLGLAIIPLAMALVKLASTLKI